MKDLAKRVWIELIRRAKKHYFKHKLYIREYLLIKQQQKLHEKALIELREKVKGGERVKVAFFAIFSSIWKLDDIYNFLLKDARFEPIIIVCPIQYYGRENMLNELGKAYSMFKAKGFKVIKTYDEEKDSYLDIRKEINPDLIFYTSPYKETYYKDYFITEFKDKLTCYVPYGFNAAALNETNYNSIFSQIVWKFFLETEIHLEMSKEFARNKSVNTVVTGYPGVDGFEYGSRNDAYGWKIKDPRIKRIIWAPHHTINNDTKLTYSNFLSYHEFMLELAEKYKDKIQICFKPHPFLIVKLYKHDEWGKEKTDEYYDKWKNGENTQINTDDYIDLFNSSDAIIHDSGSFTTEYLHCGKPCQYIMKETTKAEFNRFGLMALDQYYQAWDKADVEWFIKEVVINGNDTMKKSRDKFYHEVLKYKRDKSAAENVYEYVCKELF